MYSALVKTDCKDCGHRVYHSPIKDNKCAGMAEKFDNVHVTIFYDFASRHYMTLIKGMTQKIFMSCALSIEQIQGDKEVGLVLAWANSDGEGEMDY